MSGEPWGRGEIESPCVKVCLVHPETGYCLGCGRTRDEIARWSTMSPAERRAVMAELKSREVAPRGRRGGRRRRSASVRLR